jgi:transcriptional antiterminator RfaH
MSFWACAQTEPLRELAAMRFLGLAGYTVYCPRIRVVRPRRGGRKVVSHPPLFPSYLFVMIEVGWWSARWCPGIVKLLANGDAPMVVPDRLVDEIRSRERNGLIELERRDRFKLGEKVHVTEGIFGGHTGIYAGMRSHDRVLVLLALLGGHQRVELPEAAVVAAG